MALGLSQADLARHCGVSKQTIHRFENGQTAFVRKVPDFEAIFADLEAGGYKRGAALARAQGVVDVDRFEIAVDSRNTRRLVVTFFVREIRQAPAFALSGPLLQELCELISRLLATPPPA